MTYHDKANTQDDFQNDPRIKAAVAAFASRQSASTTTPTSPAKQPVLKTTRTTTTGADTALSQAVSFTTTTPNPSLGMVRSWSDFSSQASEAPIQVRGLAEVLATHVPESDTLLGQRYLCRKGALIIIGPSGIGKSSSSVQMAMLWAMGKKAFDITPSAPLRILMVQAENDDGDLQEMVSGVLNGIIRQESGALPPRAQAFQGFEGFESEDLIALTPEEALTLGGNLHFASVPNLSGEEFIAALELSIQQHPCDILWIDPLMAFLGADPTNTEKVMVFLRQQLNALLQKHNIAAVISHHTPKTTNRDTKTWSSEDYAYAGAGAADITNWARAILAIHPTKTPGTYKFIAAKRGKRIGWKDDQHEPETLRYFRHSRDGGLFWEPGDPEQVLLDEEQAKAAARSKSSSPEPIIRNILKEHPEGMDKTELIEMAKMRGAADKATREALNAMSEDLAIEKRKRLRARPQLMVRLKRS